MKRNITTITYNDDYYKHWYQKSSSAFFVKLKMKLSYFKKPLIAAPSKFWKWGLFIRIFQWRRLQQGMVISRKGQKRKKRLEKVNSGQLCPSQCVFKGRYVDFFTSDISAISLLTTSVLLRNDSLLRLELKWKFNLICKEQFDIR